METLSKPFTIQINDKYVAPVGNDAENGVQAKIGSEAATFTLKEGRLVSGDWVLGRNLTEDRSMGPKKIAWFKEGSDSAQRLHAVKAHEEGESNQLKFGGGCLTAIEDDVHVDLMGMADGCSTIKYEE
ncbi:hypothetical protein GRF29_8g401789 [Pseudopithomyces chartarum]|uniref:Uncharacterized protein n=1 Tax=Pseudopithomyces chartarum TaxID=1892770 RepID=A0AAN6M3A1_9PLEO|nr:hypothetical protein GRF29_8g401789 [Pseudopithomyces chartarum]